MATEEGEPGDDTDPDDAERGNNFWKTQRASSFASRCSEKIVSTVTTSQDNFPWDLQLVSLRTPRHPFYSSSVIFMRCKEIQKVHK